jgi:uncharacterized protein YjbI with pentapeptide repeats
VTAEGADLRGARVDAVDLNDADQRRADLRGATGSPASLAMVESLATA